MYVSVFMSMYSFICSVFVNVINDRGSMHQFSLALPLLILCCLRGGASGAPHLSVFTNNFFSLSKFCPMLLRIPKQMEIANIAENRITGVPLGHVW